MAEDEEKCDFTPEGEAVGYIGEEQARVLALRHARDNRVFYGRRYARQELSAEEGEDYYRIRLPYRPTGTFRGEPGV